MKFWIKFGIKFGTKFGTKFGIKWGIKWGIKFGIEWGIYDFKHRYSDNSFISTFKILVNRCKNTIPNRSRKTKFN